MPDMKNLPFLIVLTLFLAGITSAQVPSATPPPKRDDDVVKITTSLIQIDVSVTDSKGNPVSDLKPEDFEIYENGERQKISGLTYVSSARPTAQKPSPDQTAVPLPPSSVKPDQVRRTIALVVDDLSLSFESTYYVRRTLKKFVDEQMQDGDLVAIIRTGAGIGALQQFTTDKRLLYAAIEKVRWNPVGTGRIGAFAPLEPTPLQQQRAAGDTTVTDEDLANEKNSMNAFDDFRSSVFATGTLGALQYIVRGMGELPGRKSVMLLSDGFRLFERDSQGNQQSGRVLDYLRRLVDQANRASVVFYALDARGLQVTGLTAADNVVDTSPDGINGALSERSGELLDTQEGLQYLSRQTGGFAVINSNDLNRGVRRVLDDQSYYLISYEPDADTFDPAKRRFNRLDVKVNRKDVKVRYRSGFFGVADSAAVKQPANQTPMQQIQSALMSPFAVNGIGLRLNALYGNNAKDGSFVKSLLHVNAKDLKFSDTPDGNKQAAFDVLAVSFGDNGQVVEQLGSSYSLKMRGAAYDKLLRDGFVYHFTFPVKKAGAYQYRVAIRDTQAGVVGSASQFIEVPNIKKSRVILSGIVLQNLSTEQWEQMSKGNAAQIDADAMMDTALRHMRTGSVLRYGFEVYNAKAGPSGKPDITLKIRMFRDGKMIFEGAPKPIDLTGQPDMLRINASGALGLGSAMTPGDYVLQVIVTDNNAKEKEKVTTQFVQFEVG
jgi:VWFA-related protein